MDNIRPEDLGSMGESFFNTLCKDIGFVANSSKSDDKGGWDFEVEHRRTNEIDYSDQSYPVYRVQVKSTKGKLQTKLTYSNLLKLIQYGGASFIALIKYSTSLNPDSAFLLHIDESFSKTIWQEIRNKQIGTKIFALTKNEKLVKFTLKNRIRPLNGEGLQRAIRKYIGSDYLKYVENKLNYLTKLRREGQVKQFDWCFRSEKEIRAMANCFLGYQEKFNIDFSEYDAPFGIRDQSPVATFKDFSTTITPQHEKTSVILKTSKFGRQYEFNGKSYIVPKLLQQFSQKARTECKLFDFVFDYGENSLRIESKDIFSEDIRVPFKELYNFVCFLNESVNSNEIYIKLVDIQRKKTAEVCLGPPIFDPSEDSKTIFETIISAYKKLCELNLENYEISTKYVWDNFARFNLFSIMDQHFVPDFTLEFENQGNNNPDANVVIFNSVIELSAIRLIIFAAFFGTVERVRENILVGKFNKSEFIAEYLLNPEDIIEEFLDVKSEYYRKVYIEKGFKVLG